MKKPILVIEDDPQIFEVLKIGIEELGHPLELAKDGRRGLSQALKNDYALVILDINLPELSGFEVCKQLREKKKILPIIVLTSRGTEIDQVLGLELGADDFVTKPFSIPALTARIKARLRNVHNIGSSTTTEQQTPLVFGDLHIDIRQRIVTIRGETITLTVKEYNLLLFLAEHPGIPFSREQLMEQVWNYTTRAYEANVNTTVTRLRNKIEQNPEDPKYIKTIYGIGYRFARVDEL